MSRQPLYAFATFVLVSTGSGGCVGGDYAGVGPPADDRIPVADAYLNQNYAQHAGLLGFLGADGLPTTSGPDMDPMIFEARRFYDTVQYPGAQPQTVDYPDPFTGDPTFQRATAPLTFEAWQGVFGFPPRDAGEDIHAWRARSGVVIYYNQNELGLGRELGCAQFLDAVTAADEPLMGLACFVTNYGAVFNDMPGALAYAVAGVERRNTVAITYRPGMEPDYQVQFYSFGPDGRRIEWAQLDTLGPRPHPHVCMDCHGGSYDDTRHLARRAHFLPLDPGWLSFSTDSAPYGRAAQEESIRRLNVLALSTPLTDTQRAYFTGLYAGAPEQPGQPARPWIPPGWGATLQDRDLYAQVVRPYCGTCHMAADLTAGGSPSVIYRGMSARADFGSSPVGAFLCAFQMPNAQPTMTNLWRVRAGGITIGVTAYPSAADAFLNSFSGGGRELCPDLPRVLDCRRGPDPDALCGDARSGMSCDLATGQCRSANTPAL